MDILKTVLTTTTHKVSTKLPSSISCLLNFGKKLRKCNITGRWIEISLFLNSVGKDFVVGTAMQQIQLVFESGRVVFERRNHKDRLLPPLRTETFQIILWI